MKHIQLNPFSPPQHPMLQMLKKRAKKSLAGSSPSGEEIEILNQQVCEYLGIEGFNIKDIGPTEDILSKYISAATIFINTGKNFPSFPLSATDTGIIYFIRAVNFSTGILYKDHLPSQSSLVDISGLPPYSEVNGLSNRLLSFHLDGALGLDIDWVVILEKDLSRAHMPLTSGPAVLEEIKVLNYLFEDYKLQKDLLIRDYKYKAALLENIISSNSHFSFRIKTPIDRSRTVFPIELQDISLQQFHSLMLKHGFDIGTGKKNGKEYILIANFINHSKEQIEAFVDTVSSVLR